MQFRSRYVALSTHSIYHSHPLNTSELLLEASKWEKKRIVQGLEFVASDICNFEGLDGIVAKVNPTPLRFCCYTELYFVVKKKTDCNLVLNERQPNHRICKAKAEEFNKRLNRSGSSTVFTRPLRPLYTEEQKHSDESIQRMNGLGPFRLILKYTDKSFFLFE
ncbi:hypothetical protein METSCH_G01890 [Metschnikowia aff. pulcherrima]|uniref:Uncharacterized protein n=1 Tax=Metschnikowia aff. pulcherrima TaxID=2163413 RepID=A0A4P6XWX7_9ASCO|nr:hypothetical protein METSCH_G01890 [Metschnikowia aff. pulcherrima]